MGFRTPEGEHMHRFPALALALTGLLLAPAARAQENDAAGFLSRSRSPSALRLRDLTSEWRRVTLQMPDEAKGDAGGGIGGLLGGLMGGMFGKGMASAVTPPPPPVYTQGQTVTLGGEPFLVVYRAPQKPLDMAAIMKAGPAGGPPDLPAPDPLKADTLLSMSLIRLRVIQSLNDVRPFNLEDELAESARAVEAEKALRAELGKEHGGADAPIFTKPDDTAVAPAPRPPKPAAPRKPAPKRTSRR
jgi:hypothetical protein